MCGMCVWYCIILDLGSKYQPPFTSDAIKNPTLLISPATLPNGKHSDKTKSADSAFDMLQTKLCLGRTHGVLYWYAAMSAHLPQCWLCCYHPWRPFQQNINNKPVQLPLTLPALNALACKLPRPVQVPPYHTCCCRMWVEYTLPNLRALGGKGRATPRRSSALRTGKKPTAGRGQGTGRLCWGTYRQQRAGCASQPGHLDCHT